MSKTSTNQEPPLLQKHSVSGCTFSSEVLNLFDIEEKEPDWKHEWKDMPEFVQDKKKAYSQIVFRFENEEDLQAFAKLIGQKLTNKTKSAWFPFKSHWGGVKKVWTNEK